MTTQGTFSAPLDKCKPSFFVATPCVPIAKSTGHIKFKKSTSFYADNNLGDGSVISLGCSNDDEPPSSLVLVALTWLNWNEFEFESVGF